MRILVVFTGGTIGSQSNGDWIAPSENAKYILIDDYIAAFGRDVVFETISPYYILSENISHTNFTDLCKCINDNIKKDYDGIIVTHGTDTLQFSAAALAFAVGSANIPILLVSSNFPLENKNSNGKINFEAAVSFIKQKAGTGVFVAYKNSNDNVNFHYGTRVLSHAETFDDIYSIENAPYASYDKGKIVLNDKFKKINKVSPVKDVVFCERPDILVINAHPGDDFNYSLRGRKAVIIVPYHSGTINTEKTLFKVFCKKAMKKKIPVFLVNQREGFEYESKKIYDDLGIIKLPLCTFISVYMKTWIGISLNEPLDEFVPENICGEYII